MRVRTSQGRMSVQKALGKLRVLLGTDPFVNGEATNKNCYFMDELLCNLQGPFKHQAVNLVLEKARAKPSYFEIWPYDMLLQRAAHLKMRFDQKQRHREQLKRARSQPRMRNFKLMKTFPSSMIGGYFVYTVRRSQVKVHCYNSGKHLYMSETLRSPRVLVSYKKYSGNGAWFGNVFVQHLGHLHGINGGPVWLRFTVSGVCWDLHIEPRSRYCIVDLGGGAQALFGSLQNSI